MGREISNSVQQFSSGRKATNEPVSRTFFWARSGGYLHILADFDQPGKPVLSLCGYLMDVEFIHEFAPVSMRGICPKCRKALKRYGRGSYSAD